MPVPTQPENAPFRPGRELEPGVATFRRRLGEAARGRPPLDAVSPPEARRLVALARAPWCAGGPVMGRTENLAFAAATPALPFRVHHPDGRTGGTLLYLHGGGWTFFDNDTHDRLMREYAARARLVVVGADYARAPEARFPVAIEQVTAFAGALLTAPEAFGAARGALLLGGDSAGANLAVATALRLRDQGRVAGLCGLVLSYGVWDATFDRPSYREFADPAYMLTADEMRFFWDRYVPDPTRRRDPLASPLRADLRGLPPCHMAIAPCDVLADENRLMAMALRDAGVAVEANTYRGAAHSFLEAVSVSPLADRAIDEQARWMAIRAASAVA